MRRAWIVGVLLLTVSAGMVACLHASAKYMLPGLTKYVPVQWLESDLHSRDENLRIKASLWIGRHPHVSSVYRELITVAKADPAPQVRRNALIALTLRVYPRAFTQAEYVAFLDAFARNDPSPQVRQTALSMKISVTVSKLPL